MYTETGNLLIKASIDKCFGLFILAMHLFVRLTNCLVGKTYLPASCLIVSYSQHK